jgi:hypothetical protein
MGIRRKISPRLEIEESWTFGRILEQILRNLKHILYGFQQIESARSDGRVGPLGYERLNIHQLSLVGDLVQTLSTLS